MIQLSDHFRLLKCRKKLNTITKLKQNDKIFRHNLITSAWGSVIRYTTQMPCNLRHCKIKIIPSPATKTNRTLFYYFLILIKLFLTSVIFDRNLSVGCQKLEQVYCENKNSQRVRYLQMALLLIYYFFVWIIYVPYDSN